MAEAFGIAAAAVSLGGVAMRLARSLSVFRGTPGSTEHTRNQLENIKRMCTIIGQQHKTWPSHMEDDFKNLMRSMKYCESCVEDLQAVVGLFVNYTTKNRMQKGWICVVKATKEKKIKQSNDKLLTAHSNLTLLFLSQIL